MKLVGALLAIAFFDQVLDWVSASPVTYGICAAIAAVDAFFPVVPSETVVITAAALAAGGDLSIFVVFAAAAVGAFVGDNVSYFLGDRIGEPIAERVFTGEGAREKLGWGETMLERHGAAIIIAARFIPGGRTATTFAAGTLDYPWRRFVGYDAIAAGLWALYSVLVGFLGGQAFAESAWKSIVLAIGVATGVGLLIEAYRRLQKRRGRDIFGEQEEGA